MHSNRRRLTAHRVTTRTGIQSPHRTSVGSVSPVLRTMGRTRYIRCSGDVITATICSLFIRCDHCIQDGKEIQTNSSRLQFLERAGGGGQENGCRKCFAVSRITRKARNFGLRSNIRYRQSCNSPFVRRARIGPEKLNQSEKACVPLSICAVHVRDAAA